MVCVVLAFVLPVRSERDAIDPVSGSMESRASVMLIPVRTRIEQSELERWIIKNEGAYSPQWRTLSDIAMTISGRVISRGCGLAPAIYTLRAGDLNTRFARSATDEEIAEFLRTMRNGTPDEQRDAVDEALKIAMPSWEPDQNNSD